MGNTDWWMYFVGIAGFLNIMGGIVCVPIVGAALYFVWLIAGQLIFSLLIDDFGLYSFAIVKATPLRIVGVLLVFAGSVVINFLHADMDAD